MMFNDDDDDDLNNCKLKSRVTSHGEYNMKVKLKVKVKPPQVSLPAQRVVVVDHESFCVSHQ